MYQPKEIIIYFDMDGVLADFDVGKDLILGRPTPELNQSWPALTDEQKVLKATLWNTVEHHPSFFRDLPPLAEGLTIYHALPKYKKVILTASPEFGGPESAAFQSVAAQKYAWCLEHLGPVPQSDFICTLAHLKHKRIGSNLKLAILIDDRSSNCVPWSNAGGYAIHHDPTRPGLTIRHLLELGIELDLYPELDLEPPTAEEAA